MKVALAQINATVGDVEGNSARIRKQIEAARAGGAHLVIFPELAIFGYPPKDLVLRAELVRDNVAALESVASSCQDITAVIGYVQSDEHGSGKGIANAAGVCQGGKVIARYAKMLLPTYGVFDESRYFNPGKEPVTFKVPTEGSQTTVGITICEDLWNDRQFDGRRLYGVDPIAQTVNAGAELIVNLSASPFEVGKTESCEAIFAEQIREQGVPLAVVNQVGGQDDLVFGGASILLDSSGQVRARAKAFCEDLLIADLGALGEARLESYPDRIASIRQALVLGVRDYLGKCGFDKAVIGLSGGIDSALTAALAVEAVGHDRVHGVAMPSRFSSEHSIADARELAENLGIDLSIIPIEGVHAAMEEAMHPSFADLPPGIAEENIQARIRGNILMALSNRFGWLLLTTGNKSELAVGYCTLYGDMCGGLAVISDVPKTVAYSLAHEINRTATGPCIPLSTIQKAPSAELAENQLDSDSLPAYEVLDPILEKYVEQDMSVDDIVAAGFDRETVTRVACMVDRSEYKRKQAPVGIKVTTRAFGTGRRMPIAAKYR